MRRAAKRSRSWAGERGEVAGGGESGGSRRREAREVVPSPARRRAMTSGWKVLPVALI